MKNQIKLWFKDASKQFRCFLRKHIIHVFNKLCIGKLNLTFLGLTNSILQIVIFEFCETKNSSTFEKFWLGPEAKDNTKEKSFHNDNEFADIFIYVTHCNCHAYDLYF